MNNLPPRLEKYDKDGWYRYLNRAVNLKNAPNLDLDMNVFTRCIVGRCRKGAIYFSKEKAPETYCETCKKDSYEMSKAYALVIFERYNSAFLSVLDEFLNHMEKVHVS